VDQDHFRLASDDTMRNLEAAAARPGDEQRYRMLMVHAIKDLRKEIALTRIEMRKEFKEIKAKQLDLTDVAKHVKIEIDADSGISQLKVDVKRLWTAGAWVLSVVGAAILAVAMTKVIGHP
jgi:hypothetical protein